MKVGSSPTQIRIWAHVSLSSLYSFEMPSPIWTILTSMSLSPKPRAEAKAEALRIEREINAWAVLAKRRNAIDADEYKYILNNTAKNAKDPHGYFYLLYKVRKKRKIPNETPSRPVCSDVASITNPIGKWVDIMLQPIAQAMPTFFKDSYDFKDLINSTVCLGSTNIFFL